MEDHFYFHPTLASNYPVKVKVQVFVDVVKAGDQTSDFTLTLG
jgi:hypothetical protein